MNYKLSIIVATYNSGRTLEETIISIIGQTYKNIELIIIDGCSSDNTVDIIRKYDSKVNYWISEQDDGLYYALNKGIDRATGDYIEIIGSDDFFINNQIISKVMAEIDDNVDILSTGCYVVDEKYNIQKYYGNAHAVNKKNFTGWMIPHAGMFVKTEIYRKYKFNTKYKIAADYDFFLKCYNEKRIFFKFCNYPTYYFSLNGISSNLAEIEKENKLIRSEYKLNSEKERSYIAISIGLLNKSIKKILDVLGMGRLWRRKISGWDLHNCNNYFCRWCRTKKGFYI